MRANLLLGWTLIAAAGCTAEVVPLEGLRPGSSEDGGVDPLDALPAPRDARPRDAGRPDSGRPDSGVLDTGFRDDATVGDTGLPPGQHRVATTPYLQSVSVAALPSLGGRGVLEVIWTAEGRVEGNRFQGCEPMRQPSGSSIRVYGVGRAIDFQGSATAVARGERGGATIVAPRSGGALLESRMHLGGLVALGTELRWLERDPNGRRIWLKSTDPVWTPVAVTGDLVEQYLIDAWTDGTDAAFITDPSRVVIFEGGATRTVEVPMEAMRLLVTPSGARVVVGAVPDATGRAVGAAMVLGSGAPPLVLEGTWWSVDYIDATSYVRDGVERIALAWNDLGTETRFAEIDLADVSTRGRMRIRDRVVPRSRQSGGTRPAFVWEPISQTGALAWLDVRSGATEVYLWCGIEM